MSGNRFHFTSTWGLPFVAPLDAFLALYELIEYPRWWPEFRDVRRVGRSRHWMLVRSFLPYEIAYVLTQEVADRGSGVLQGWVEGDIEGLIRWDIVPGPRGSIVHFDEDVVTRAALLDAIAPFAAPLMRLNHDAMMRSGLTGLRAYIAGRRLCRPGPRPEPRPAVGAPQRAQAMPVRQRPRILRPAPRQHPTQNAPR